MSEMLEWRKAAPAFCLFECRMQKINDVSGGSMRIKSNRLLAAAVVGLLSGSTSAFATNGSFMIGSGAGSIGMGGVGITSPQDSMCVGGNPACLGEFDRPQFDIGAGLFRPVRSAATTVQSGSGQYADSEVNLYLLPSMGFVWPFDDQLTVGFAALPAGGGGVTFEPGAGVATGAPPGVNFLSGVGPLGTDLVQLIIPITAAYKVNETNTLGASIVPARQRFLAQGLGQFNSFTEFPGRGYENGRMVGSSYTDNGHDFANGLGARIGWMGYFFDRRITLGATYATKVYMEKFEHYKGLFAERGSFDIPSNYGFGIGIKPVENLTVAADVVKIQYSDVPAFANRGPDGHPSLTVPGAMGNLNVGSTGSSQSLGNLDGAGFGWVDQIVWKLGVSYKPNDNWTLRAGYNFAKSPIPKDQLLFSVLATASTEKHYTAGFTYNMGEQSILGFGSEGLITFAYMFAPNTRTEGDTLGFDGHTGFAGFQMRQQSWDLAYTLKF